MTDDVISYQRCMQFKMEVFKKLFLLYLTNIKWQSVLGRQSCEEIGLINRVNTIHLDKYADLFSGLGCLLGKYHIALDKSATPVVCASRKIPLSLKD